MLLFLTRRFLLLLSFPLLHFFLSTEALQLAARKIRMLNLLTTTSTRSHRSLTTTKAARARATLHNKMRIVHKTAYWGQITIGSQPFNVIFDTGSGNLILPSSACKGPGCDSHRKYNPENSKSSVRDPFSKTQRKQVTNDNGESEAEISFGTGDISGKFYNDKLCLGEEEGQICVAVNFIGATQQSPEPFAATPFDGIMGLGYRDLSMGSGFNIVDDLVDKGALPNGMFSFALADSGPSSITFGGYRPETVRGDIFWTPVTVPSYWQIKAEDIMLDGVETKLCGREGCQVAVDTGTSMLAGPSELIEELTRKVKVREDCSNYKNLPILGFRLGDKVLNLRPEEYVDNDRGQTCSFSLMSLDVPPPKGPLFIFGDPFLRRFVTVFDRENSRVGFGISARGGGGESNLGAITEAAVAAATRETGKSSISSVLSTSSSFSSSVDISLAAGMMEGEEANQEDLTFRGGARRRQKSQSHKRRKTTNTPSTTHSSDASTDVEPWEDLLKEESGSKGYSMLQTKAQMQTAATPQNLITIELHQMPTPTPLL